MKSKSPSKSKDGSAAYEAKRKWAAEHSRALSLAGREIGTPPKPKHPKLREKAERDFRFFCERYMAAKYSRPWSPDHLRVIARIETVTLEGGLYGMVMPRGSGKTSLSEDGCLWSLVCGHRRFVVLIGSDAEAASDMLDSIKAELETNDLLAEDFPEVCFPIRKLEGIALRARGQTSGGEPTNIGWTADEMVLPTIAGSKASGGIIRVRGITGRIRGLKVGSQRPDLVLIDDPQTEESANSPTQCDSREATIRGAILGLAGPGQKIAGLATLTVVRSGDLADRLLDRDRNPQWQAERMKLVYAWPTATKLWEEYAEKWRDGLRTGEGTAAATEFYRSNRPAMDEGAVVGWKDRFNPDELSAIQHAHNLRLERGEPAFQAEYQNEPINPALNLGGSKITAELVEEKRNQLRRQDIPGECVAVTCHIDVQRDVLFFVVAAWTQDFRGYVIDYGSEPEQPMSYFSLSKVATTLAQKAPGAGFEGALYAGLSRLTARLLSAPWRLENGTYLAIGRCLIDARWGKSTDVVRRFTRESPFHGVLLPSLGEGITASKRPMSQYRQAKGDKAGLNWRIPVPQRGQTRYVHYDTNFWKSFAADRLCAAPGDIGSLTIFGHERTGKPNHHQMLADHLTAEFSTPTIGRERRVDEWALKRGGLDNHLFDCLVGSFVAASMEGCSLPTVAAGHVVKQTRKYASIEEMKERALSLRR